MVIPLAHFEAYCDIRPHISLRLALRDVRVQPAVIVCSEVVLHRPPKFFFCFVHFFTSATVSKRSFHCGGYGRLNLKNVCSEQQWQFLLERPCVCMHISYTYTYIYIYIFIYVYVHVHIQSYLSSRNQALTVPGKPPLAAQELGEVAFGTFWWARGGDFLGTVRA